MYEIYAGFRAVMIAACVAGGVVLAGAAYLIYRLLK